MRRARTARTFVTSVIAGACVAGFAAAPSAFAAGPSAPVEANAIESGAPGARALDAGPSGAALLKLEKLRDALRDAEDRLDRFGPELGGDLRDAREAKIAFFLTAFRGKLVLGQCDFAHVLVQLERIDGALTRAVISADGRNGDLRSARAAARDLLDLLEGCSGEAQAGIANSILEFIRELIGRHEDGRLDQAALQEASAAILRQKKSLLFFETVDGCAAVSFYALIDRIDRRLTIARELQRQGGAGGAAGGQANGRIRRAIDGAIEDARKLSRLYRGIPCEEGDGG